MLKVVLNRAWNVCLILNQSALHPCDLVIKEAVEFTLIRGSLPLYSFIRLPVIHRV